MPLEAKYRSIYSQSILPSTAYNLRQTTAAEDLNVLLDEKLNFSKHIGNIVSDANRRVGLFHRSLLTLNKKSFVTLFKTLVFPKLEYNNSMWFPNYRTDLKNWKEFKDVPLK